MNDHLATIGWGTGGVAWQCKRCGTVQPVPTTKSLGAVCADYGAWLRRHADCQPGDDGAAVLAPRRPSVGGGEAAACGAGADIPTTAEATS